MNPYKEDGLRARLSFDRAYCKRCTGPSSVNDGYITGPGADPPAAPRRAARRGNAIATIETLVRQRSKGAFIMRV